MRVIKITPGYLAYTADIQAQPVYHDGVARPDWRDLSPVAQWSWERNPTPRHYNTKSAEAS